MSVILCGSCGFENDTTRVFCQNCGTRLDPDTKVDSASKLFIPPTQPDGPAVSSQRPVKPIRPVLKRDYAPSQGNPLRKLVALALWAAVLAALIQMARKPENVPAPLPANETQASALYGQLKANAESSAPRALRVTESQINAYLAAKIIPAPDDQQAIYKARFVRMFTLLGKGDYRLVTEQSLFKWPVYIYLIQMPVANGNGLVVQTSGGGVGRLPVHPALLPLLQKVVTPEAISGIDALGPLSKVSGISIAPDGVNLLWVGALKKTP